MANQGAGVTFSYHPEQDVHFSLALQNAFVHPFDKVNRFHVALQLFSNKSQMTSKCGKNEKVAHKALTECITDVFTTF